MKKVTKRPPAYEQIFANRGISLPISAKNAKMMHQAFSLRFKKPMKIGDVTDILLLDMAIQFLLKKVDGS